MHDLTGAPSFVYYTNNKKPNYVETLWQRLLEGKKKDYIMAASVEGNKDQMKKLGLVAGHAYGILAAHEV